MGIGSYDVNRRRLSGGVPDEPGGERPPDAARRAVAADVPRHRPQARRDRARDRRAAATRFPRPRGTPSSPTSTTTASSTCSSRRATSKTSPTTRRRTRPTCSSASRTARSSRRAEAAGIVDFARGRGAALADFNLDGLPDLVEVFYDAPVRVWRNEGTSDSGCSPAAGPLAGRPADRAGAERGRHRRRGSRSGSATSVMRREVTVGGGHAGGELGWQHFGLGPASSADVRVTWPDGTVGPWQRRLC